MHVAHSLGAALAKMSFGSCLQAPGLLLFGEVTEVDRTNLGRISLSPQDDCSSVGVRVEFRCMSGIETCRESRVAGTWPSWDVGLYLANAPRLNDSKL